MIHWTGKGYLAIAVPLATSLVGTAVNRFAFHGQLSNDQISSPSLICAALILQFLIHRFPDLRMREEQPDNGEDKSSSPYFTKVEPTSERIIKFLKVRRHAPHTFFWIPLSVYPIILGGFGISKLFSLR